MRCRLSVGDRPFAGHHRNAKDCPIRDIQPGNPAGRFGAGRPEAEAALFTCAAKKDGLKPPDLSAVLIQIKCGGEGPSENSVELRSGQEVGDFHHRR